MNLILIRDDATAAEVAVQGGVTADSLDPLNDPLLVLLGPEAYGRRITLDLRQAEHLDSSGIGWLLACHKRMRQVGGTLKLCHPSPLVAGVLKLMKLDRVLEIEPPLSVGPRSGIVP